MMKIFYKNQGFEVTMISLLYIILSVTYSKKVNVSATSASFCVCYNIKQCRINC